MMQEVEAPTGSTCPNDFSDTTNQDIRTQYALSWKSGIRVAVGDCSVTERRRPPYQNCKCARKNTTNTTRASQYENWITTTTSVNPSRRR